ncbi:MAG TPA: DUF4375 domain-containing protein [Terriglobales bacterium]|nr:DUF4375 domain-containing protein [Terriglobales bacterium]
MIAIEDYEHLTPLQRVASLAFWYDSEVQNGGHLQYFENSAGRRAEQTISALDQLGLPAQRRILAEAVDARCSMSRSRINTVEEYVAIAEAAEFAQFDRAYYECKPTIPECLEKFLEANFAEFIELA